MARHDRFLLVASCSMLLTLGAACGEQRKPCPEAPGSFACVDGATLALASANSCEFPLESTVGVEAQTARALELAGTLWGMDPTELVTGWTITYCRGWFVCAGGGTASWTWGCAHLDTEVIQAAPGPSRCVTGVLIHELGHLVVGDLAHEDPRFTLADDMEARPCE
jgi:hypothetical protein